METTKKLSLDDIFGKASAPASSEAVKSIDDIFGQKEAATPVAPYGTMTDEIRGVSHAPADLIGVSPHPAIIGENELQKNRAGFEEELKSTAGAIQPTQESSKPMSADAFKVGGDVAMPGAIDKPKSLSQTVQSEINKRWGGDLQSIIGKARSVNPENVNLAEDMESHFWKVMKDKVPSDSFITQEDLDGFKFTRDYSNGDKDIEYSFGHYTYPQEVVNEYVARHNDEVLHNMRFKEEPEYRNEWFLRNVGVTEQAYRDGVAADLENRLHELRKKVVATLPAQHTRGGYAAIGAAANKPSSGAPVSIEKIDKALKTVNTLRKNSFGAGLKEGFDLADILTLGISGIGENVALLNALNKSASGKTLTTSEQALVEAWDIQNEAEEVIDTLGGRRRGANIGYGVSQSLGFMTQTAGTGGVASFATKGIGRAAARVALRRATNMGVNKSIKEGLRYGGLKVAESAVGAAARTPFMGFTYRNYTDKRLNQFQVNERVDEATGEISKYIDKQEASALRDVAHAVLESYFENQSEDVGGLIDFGITSFARALPLKGLLRNRAAEALRGPVKNGAMKWIKEGVKLHSIIGEMLSEAYGDAMVNLLTANNEGWKHMASSEYWWELLGVSSMLSGGFWVANKGVNFLAYKDERKAINKNLKQRKESLSRIEDDNLKKELTEATLTDDVIDRSKRLSSLNWSNYSREDMANAVDFIDAQTRLDVLREGATESRRLARIMPAIDEVKTLADNGALDEDQAAASLAVIYSDLFRTQENQRALNILTDRIKVAADAGISADEINEILRGAGLTVFNPGDEIETLTGDRAIVDKVLPGAYEVVNNEGDRAVVSFEEVLQNTPEVRQIQQESNQTEGQTESAPENNPQVEQAVADARAQVAEIINKDDSTVYEVETDDGITGYIIGGKGIVVDNDGRINQSAEDTVVVKTDEGNRVVHKERVKVKNRQTLQEIEDLARGAAEGALAAVQPQQPDGGKTYQGIYDNEPVTITLPREIKFNEDGTVDYDNLMNPETVSVIRPNGAVVDEVGLNEIEQLTEAEQVSADASAVEQQEVTNLEPDFSAIRPVSIGDFGPIYDQFRGNAKDAIALLLQRKDGEAVGALSHPEVGEIDLVWGREGTSKSDGYGLSKLAKYHPEVLENLQEILNDMKVASRTENRVQLESDTHKASVRLTWNEQKKNWLLTAFEKKEASASIGKKTDTDDNPKDLRGDTALSQNTDALSDNKDTTSEPNNQEEAQKNVTETAPVVQQPQIPLLKNGEPDYNAMDARMFAEQYVTRFGEGATERIARNNIKASNKTISTIEKQIEDVTDPNKMPALYSKLQEAQATKDKYSAVLEELGLSADESEDNAARIQRKKQENTPWFNKLFPDGFPNVESVILWDIANGNRIRWTNKEVNGAVVSKGLGSHLGLSDSNAERTRRVALIGKDAPTPEEYAEQLPERLNAMGIRFEESELLDKVIAVYTSVDTARKAKEELEKISANIQAEQEGLDYEEEQMRRNYEREQEALRQEAQPEVGAEQTEQEQPTNEETQGEELSIEDEVPFMVSSDSVHATTEAQQLATEAAITALEDAGVEVVNATPEMVEEALQRKDVQLQAVNQKFNEQLDSFTEENATSVVFDLGMPSPILLAGGVADKPIKLYGNKLLKKIRKHGLNLEELKGLPIAIANPIAIFDNYRKSGNRSVLTELKTKDGNILVSIEIGMGVDINFDMVKSVFGKDDNGVLNWINKGYLTFVDKEKALGYLYPSAPIAATANSQELDSATKIVENFENPNIVPANSFAVENPSLVGLHNISEEKLRKAFRLGGLANPSVAVIDSNSQKHTGYGDITLVLPSAMIAKKTGKNIGTYFGDAWTPTYPEVQKQLGNNQASQDIMELPDEMQNSVRLALNSWLDGRSGDSLSYMFLHQRGDAPEIHRTQAEFSPELHEAMTHITGGQDFYYLNDEERNRVLDLYVQEKHDGSRDEFNAHMRRVIERGNRLIAERGENSLIGRKAKEAIDTINEYGYDYDSVSGFVREVHRDMEYSGTVDPQYTLLLAERKVKENGLEGEFAQWLDSLEDRYAIKEVIFKGYTPSGNSRYVPNTLENASKEMRLQGRAGATGLSIGFSNFAARLLQPGVTHDDIRKRKHQLKTSIEEVDAFKDKWSSVMFDLGEKCQPNATGYEDYGLERLAEAATKNDPQAYLKSEYGVDLSDEDVKRLKDMVKAIRTEYPVMYFETKFERPVYFNEFAGAVVPDNASADVIQSLKAAGVPVWVYAASDENARMDAIKNIANSSNDIFFSIGPAPVFVSNAKIAVLGIKQEKATPEQWLKMIEKAGGLKAGEDKWIGLSDWLKASDKKTLTKQEVLDYINENQIQIEEVEYGDVENNPRFKELQAEYQQVLDENDRNDGRAFDEMVERYGDDFRLAFSGYGNELHAEDQFGSDAVDYFLENHSINETRRQYTTDGLENKREIALTVPNIESWHETDEIHFGDAGDGRAIAWARFGETTDEDGKRVLVIVEIQSKRHQEGREKGYRFEGDVAKAREDADEAYRKVVSFENEMAAKYGDQYWTGDATNEEVDYFGRLQSEWLTYEDLANKQRESIPEAPFEKNWAELAMKRMLRYAAENGFDKVAWTKGNQQAERYSLGAVLQGLKAYKTSPNTYYVIPYNNGVIGEFVKEYPEKELADTFGKELAAKIIANTENATEDNPYEIEGDGLRIGGEGMRAFYDQMLPSFMRKYGKKWGATVQDVTLPYVEEAGRTMHSVDVTDLMRESVMQGQPMFYRRPNGTVYGWTNGTTVYLTESGMNPNTPIHEYTHIWADAMRKHNPEGWKSIVKLLKGTPVWNEVMDDTNYANIHSDEHKVASEALSRISGRENSAKMEAMAQQMIDENANDTVKKNRARKLLDRMRKALQEFWSWVGKELFGIKNFERIEQVTDRILYDLVSGTDLTSVSSFDTPAAEHAEEVASNAQKIADKFGLSNEIIVAETQEVFVNELQSENVADELNNPDAIAVFTPSGRIMVNAQMISDIAELPDSIMHEFAHNVTHIGSVLYRLQDTVLEVGEERFEAAGREIFGQTTDPLVVADEIIATFVGNAANSTLYDGEDLVSRVFAGYSTEEAIRELLESLPPDLHNGYADVVEAVMPYVKEVLDVIKTNHDGPRKRTRASEDYRDAQAETGRVRISFQGYSGSAEAETNRFDNEANAMHATETSVHTKETFGPEGVNEFSIGNGEEIDQRTHSEGEFVLSATSLEDAGANLQPDAGVDGEGGLQFRGGLLQSREGVTADAGGQMGGGTRADRADLAESNQTAKSDSRTRLIAELRQKLRDVKAETRTVAAEVGKIVRKAITAELIDKMGKRTFDNIVRTIETATVRRDVEYAVNRIEEAVLDMELRDKQDKFDKYLNLRVQGESARGVSIAANVTDQVRQFITIIRDNLDRPASEVEALIEERGGSLAERTGLQVLGFYQDARNFEREVQEIEDEIEKIKSENTELRKKRAALNKAGKTNDAKNLSDQINANKETIEHLNSERISTKRSQLYYIDMAANELEREIAYGKEGHKEWLQQEAERKQELIKIAWHDIRDGKKIPILDEQEPIWKKTKNAVVDFLLAPAYSWDYLLKMISVNAPNGEGALYDHFMRSENGYVAASGNYYQAYEDFKARLNEKAKDIFGKDYKQVLKDSDQPLDVTIQISAQYAKPQSTTDENKIREGAFEIYTPTIGEVVYAYMAAKMPDGRVKLDKMGVKEDIIDSLVRQIPQGYITFADWVQNEFLPERRKVYNKTHLEVFGTQMAQIENYVPLKVKKDFVYEEFDGSKIDKAELPSSITGSIIKRKRNSLPIDLHTNIFDLLLDHGQQMEHWNAYTRIVRDTNQFLSNTQIRRALDYRKKGLHKKLKEAALIASNSYQPDVDRLEKMTVALSKTVASSKIAFRINTAIKQVLSYPAFYAYVVDAHFWGYLTRNLGPDTWGRNFRWALDNIPSFQERWLGRMAGDDRLAQMTSPKLDRWIKGMGSLGMLSNALVDAVTCANGAQAVYRYEHERYLKIGLDESEADRLAKIAAAQALNQTQQSSEGMYLSRIQADRTAFAVAISTFQNSNFAYLRKELEGIDQLMRDTTKQIANREKYYEQQGVNPDQAAKLALQDVVSANRTAVAKILVFGFILSTIWTLGNSVWKYAFGDEDEEDKWEDAAIRGFFNSFTRNLSVGQYIETVAWSDFRELNPSLLLSDLNMFIERLESIAESNVKMWDRTAAWTVLSTLSSLGLGVDINSFASMYEGVQGAIDNGANVEDIMLLVNAPRSQAKFIAGPPKEGETLDEYIKRQAWIERKIVSRIDKKQLDKWSRNYEAYKQAKMLGVPYSQDKMGRVSVPYIKDIDDSYSALLKSVGRTKSGAKRNDGDSIADDVKTRIRDFGLIKRIKDINALEKNLDAMVILDGAYPERLKELCEAKQQLIEEWNQ